MLKKVFLLVLVVWVVVGCGDDAADQTTTTSPGLVCPDPAEVASQDELLTLLASTLWAEGWEGTAHLVVEGTITLDSAAVPLHEDCLSRTDCRHEAALYVSDPVPGVTIAGPGLEDYNAFTDSRRLVFTDTAVRIVAAMRDTHPGPYNYVPTLTVHPPCGTPCAAGLLMCPANGLCYDFAGYYLGWCLGCEGRDVRECACRNAEGPLPDGARCYFAASGDVRCSGTCRDGVCVSSDGAGC